MKRLILSRKTALVFSASAIAAFFAIALLEVVLHAHFHSVNGYWLFLGRKAYQVPYTKPVADRRQYSLREGVSDGTQSINTKGFRGPLLADDDSPVICVLGDSVPFGAGVRDNETFPVHLQSMLDQRGYRYRVLNAGVPSYNLRQSIDRWDIDVRRDYKCAVIVLNAANDVSLIDYYKDRWNLDITWASERFGIADRGRSSIAFYISALLRPTPPLRANSNPFDVLRADFGEQIARPLALGIPVVLMPVAPCYYAKVPIDDARNTVSCKGYPTFSDAVKNWGAITDRVNAMLRESSSKPHVTFLDTSRLLDEGVGRAGMYIDYIHFSDQGNLAIATAIADHLAATSIITRADRSPPSK